MMYNNMQLICEGKFNHAWHDPTAMLPLNIRSCISMTELVGQSLKINWEEGLLKFSTVLNFCCNPDLRYCPGRGKSSVAK